MRDGNYGAEVNRILNEGLDAQECDHAAADRARAAECRRQAREQFVEGLAAMVMHTVALSFLIGVVWKSVTTP